MGLNKWDYVRLISDASNKYGDKLVEMMEYYKKSNLREITLDEAKEFYEQLNKK